LRTDTAEVEALFQVTPLGDTVTLAGEFFARRQVGRSRRGLPLWEEDTYRRLVRLAWSDTVRIYPFGAGKRGQDAKGLRVELGLTRPDPARSARERALALDADVVCLRVARPADTEPLGTICGRLNNVGRQLALPTGDTLTATFVWPGWR